LAERGYENRSEAVRDLISGCARIAAPRRQPHAHCVRQPVVTSTTTTSATWPDRLVELQHRYHDLCVSTLHAHLDHENCLESVILRGHLDEVQAFADRLIAERGVRHGQLNVVTADLGHRHAHATSTGMGMAEPHLHLKPRG